MTQPSPFHEGELKAQRLAGEAAQAARNAPMIGDRIPSGAVGFIRQQVFAVLGSRNAGGALWASMLFGHPGFLDPSVDRRALAIHLPETLRDSGDPLWSNIETNPRVGLLTIELATRRRLRMNGHVSHQDANTLSIDIEECFGNCPKYIQRRIVDLNAANDTASSPAETGTAIGPREAAIIQRADTFFVASGHPERGIDASHRGGNPGFVEVVDNSTLRVPDYAGNSMFNTIGNLLIDPNAGIIFPGFEGAETLQLTGKAEVLFTQSHHSGEPDDTGRSWLFHIDQWRRAELPYAVRTRFFDYSPYNPEL